MRRRSVIHYIANIVALAGSWSFATAQSQIDVQPRLIHRPKVDFPKSQQLNGVYSATVLVEVIVSSNGTVTAVDVLSSPHEDFTKMAEEFASKSRFTPPMKDGRPVNAKLRWPLVFMGEPRVPPPQLLPGPVPPLTRSFAREIVADVLSTQAAIDTHPHLVSKPAASFSANLAARKLPSSTVTLNVTVNRKGSVTVWNVVGDHHEELARIATGFAKGCRFTPPLKNGNPVDARFIWPIHFRP